MLLPSLGISIANVALPTLGAAFGASGQQVQWVVIAYLVAVTAFLVTAGRLGDLLGRRRLLLAGIAIFTLASLGASLASSLWVVVMARAVQGIGAAMMMSLTVAAVGDAVPKDRTGSAMGLLGTVSAIGTAAGPSLGGLLIAGFGWPAIFLLTAGTGLLALLFVSSQLPEDPADGVRPASFDIGGTLILILSVAAVALATTLTPTGSLNAVLAALAALGILAFVRVEASAAAPLVQLRMLGHRGIASGLVSIALVSAIMMTTLVVGPFYLTGVLGLDPAATGLVMSVGPTVSALVGVPAGRLVDRFGSVRAVLGGLSGVLIGTLAMTMLPGAFGIFGYVASLVVITSGYALFQAANNTSVMASAKRDQRGVISALLSLARNLGLVTGASAIGSLFAVGSSGALGLGLKANGQTGLLLAFVASAVPALAALIVSTWGHRPPLEASP